MGRHKIDRVIGPARDLRVVGEALRHGIGRRFAAGEDAVYPGQHGGRLFPVEQHAGGEGGAVPGTGGDAQLVGFQHFRIAAVAEGADGGEAGGLAGEGLVGPLPPRRQIPPG